MSSNYYFKDETDAVPPRSSQGNKHETPNPFIAIKEMHGKVIQGGHYTIHTSGGKTTLFNTVIHANSDSSDGSDFEADGGSPPKVRKAILESELPISVENKYIVAEGIGKKYMKMALHLKGAKFTTADIENIKFSNRDLELVEIVVVVLEKWYQRAPDDATVGNLAAVLQKIGRIDLANKLQLKADDS